MKSKKALFSFIEVAFTLLIISGMAFYSFYESNENTKYSSYHLQGKSFLHNFNFSSQQRQVIIEENISSQTIEQNWTSINTTISKQFLNYGLYVGNITHEKQIVNCEERLNRKSFQKLFFSNESVYTQKTLRLEVCY